MRMRKVWLSFAHAISEVSMFAFVLIFMAVVSRVVPHPGWLNFTAVGGSLLYFGARRPLRQAILPVALLAGTDFCLTTYAYRYPFHLGSYMVTWVWYAAIILLGAKMLKANAGMGRVAGAAVLSATSFFVLSNFAVWAGSVMYPASIGGLTACYAAALPFYRNDLISTLAVTALAFGAPELVSRLVHMPAANGPVAG